MEIDTSQPFEGILEGIIEKTKEKLNNTDTDLNTLDLLQTYDQYIKKNRLSFETKTKVYRGLLKWSQDNLQSNATSESNSTSGDALNSDLEFEFRENSTFDKSTNQIQIEEKKNKFFDDSEIERKAYPQKMMKLPKLTFDSIIETKTVHSCANNMSKNSVKPPIASKIKNSKVYKSSEKPLKHTPSNGERRFSTAESSEHVGGRLTPNFRNRDPKMDEFSSPYMMNHTQIRDSSLSITNDRDSVDDGLKRSEPRMLNRFSSLVESYDSDEYKQQIFEEYSITHDERVAIDFHEKKLQIKVWRSLLLLIYNNRRERNKYLMADSHYRTQLLEQAIKGLMKNTRSNLIEKLEQVKGDELFEKRVFRKFFTKWKYAMMEVQSENFKVQQARNKLDFSKKLIILRRWKQAALFSKIRKARLITAVHIDKKRLMKLAWRSFKVNHAIHKYEKLRWNQAERFEQIKLLTTSFKILNWYKNKRKVIHKLEMRVEYAYNVLTKKRGIKTFVKNCRESAKRRKLEKLADDLHAQKLYQKYFEVIQTFAKIKKGLKDQEF